MDVQPGHCWRCEKILPEHTVPCSRCPMAVYCSTQCRDRDSIRHSAVECEMFGEKQCSACGKAGKTLPCSACNSAWYCNTDCQRRDFPAHWKKCREILTSIKQIASKLNRLQEWFNYGDYPEYFGNTMAVDFLQLDNNEWSGKNVGDKQLDKREYHILSAGCGELRNTVLTAASLPTEYQGKLHVTLNDLDPFVLARNVLFLFMLVRFADTDYIASSLTTIWYSLHISKREYDLIKTSLDELIQMSAQQLSDATRGLVSVLDEELRYLRAVWRGWQSLECRRDNRASINLRKQRQNMFENSDPIEYKGERSRYLRCLNANDRKQMEKWFEHGLFLPCEANQRDIPFDNPTLTAPEASKLIAPNGCIQLLERSPEMPKEVDKFLFKYLITPSRNPFIVWDCLRVREHTPGSHTSPMVMYHKYVTNLLQKVKSLILQGRLLIHVSLANYLDFPKHHQTLNMPNYDRIFTSNLADFYGFAKLLQIFKPLLNASNSFSVLVTEIMQFYANVPAANPTQLPEPQIQKLICDYSQDWQTTEAVWGCHIFEYYNSTPHFLQYLRAEIMAGGFGIPALQDVPSFEKVKKHQGLRMRDFRKELNKLVPFQNRCNIRDLTMAHPGVRAVEWLLPKTES
ncbi:uncharacterized protein LOC119736924 [Patiria miniata]|uniref:MYND-type domain-containing protein n=1 Tax=Patiria miniata TaxID=46514 RepID=A0A914ATR9_PATMI|nr:uncharacterized protein LOC119736924 [Patiria miniata]